MKRNPHPQHRVIHDSDAVKFISREDASMRGDNPSWENRARPILDIVAQLAGTGSTAVIRAMARRQGISSTMTEESLCWLQARGRVERDSERKWRVK